MNGLSNYNVDNTRKCTGVKPNKLFKLISPKNNLVLQGAHMMLENHDPTLHKSSKHEDLTMWYDIYLKMLLAIKDICTITTLPCISYITKLLHHILFIEDIFFSLHIFGHIHSPLLSSHSLFVIFLQYIYHLLEW